MSRAVAGLPGGVVPARITGGDVPVALSALPIGSLAGGTPMAYVATRPHDAQVSERGVSPRRVLQQPVKTFRGQKLPPAGREGPRQVRCVIPGPSVTGSTRRGPRRRHLADQANAVRSASVWPPSATGSRGGGYRTVLPARCSGSRRIRGESPCRRPAELTRRREPPAVLPTRLPPRLPGRSASGCRRSSRPSSAAWSSAASCCGSPCWRHSPGSTRCWSAHPGPPRASSPGASTWPSRMPSTSSVS
jgi:hypothetical protein